MLSACGGRAAVDAADIAPSNGWAGSGSEPEATSPSSDAGLPDPIGPERCADTRANVTATRIWRYDLGLYGAGPGNGFFGFSPDGSKLVIHGDEYAPMLTSVSMADFSVQREDIDHFVVARDAEWRMELRATTEPYYYWISDVSVVDLNTGASRYTGIDDASMTLLSGDGQRVVTLQLVGAEESLGLMTVSLATGEARSVTTDAPIGTEGWPGAMSGGVPRIVTRNGAAVLVSDFASGAFYSIDTTTGRWMQADGHLGYDSSSSDRSYSGAVVSLTLSPSESRVASVGADHRLRVWTYPDLAGLLLDVPTTWMNAYSDCYTTPVSYAPVAWSPDETFIAAPDADGNVAVRRTCDGALLTTIPRPETLFCTLPDASHLGPSFIAFSPDGSLLGVFFDGSLELYRIE